MKNYHDEEGHIRSFIQKLDRMKDLRTSRGYFSNDKTTVMKKVTSVHSFEILQKVNNFAT
jgi:hypothetical protein